VTRLALPLVLSAVLLTGCTGSADQAATSSTAGGSAALSDSGEAAPAPSDEDTAATLARADLAGSAVVRTAELGVRVDDVRRAADDAGRLVREAGGGVAAERTDGASDAGDQANAELVLRVPPERFDELLGRLVALGEERSRSVSTEEVGDQLVDLESRLATQRASVARVQTLLAEATNLGEVVQVEAELTRRTADLESLQARVAALQGQVQQSTVVLRLDGDGPVAAAGPSGFLDGLNGGWTALLATLSVLAVLIGAVLPFVPLALVALLIVVRARRRRPASGAAAA